MAYEHNPDLPKVTDVIPHRPPRLWLDGVTELQPDRHARGFWMPDNHSFEGHFENMPILQGVQQVESLAQLGAYAVMAGSDKPLMGLFKGIEETKFERPVRPGEILDLAVTIMDMDKRNFKGRGVAEVSGELACDTIIIGTLLPERVAMRFLRSE